MALSSQSVVSDGTLVLLDVSIDYFSREEITVLFNNLPVATGWAWVGVSEAKIAFTPPVPLGVQVKLQRITDATAARHVFSAGAAFRATTVDENFTQIARIAQEQQEGAYPFTDAFTDIDYHDNHIENLGDALLPGDAVNLRVLEQRIIDSDSGQIKADLASTLTGKGASLVGWKSPGSGAVDSTVYAKLGYFVGASDFGASPAASAAVNTAALQAAIDYVDSLGGGDVLLDAGRYLINDTLILRNKVRLVGRGSSTTEIYVANGTNKTAIKSYNYDNLVGTDSWLVDAGEFGMSVWAAAANYSISECVRPSVANGNYYRVKVDAGSSGGTEPIWPTTPLGTVVDGGITWEAVPYATFGYGLAKLRINGNKTNQASGSGVQFYGKRLRIDDVIITSCKDEGWHSESNYSIPGAQATNGDDLPEGLIRGLYVRTCGSHGMVYRGQHDTLIESLFADSNDGWGVRFETDAVLPTVYSGNCDTKFMHVYANGLGGVAVGANASIQCAFMITESNFGEGLNVDSTAWQTKIGQLQLYNNNRSTGTYQAVLAGSECQYGNIHSKLAKSGKAHISVSGARNRAHITIVSASADGAAGVVGGVAITASNSHIEVIAAGNGSAGIGVDLDSSGNDVKVTAEGYSGVGGIGLRTNNGGSRIGNSVTGYLLNNATLWNNVTVGSLNHYNLRGFANAGQVGLSGVGSNTVDAMEDWNIRFSVNGVNQTSETRQSQSVDLNTTAEQVLTFSTAMLLGQVLETEDFNLSFTYFGANTTFAIQYIRLQGWDATTATVKVKLSVAAGSAQTGFVTLQARV